MDIDLDFKSSFKPQSVFPNAVTASMVLNGELVKHPCGVYLETMPKDQQTGLAAIPYQAAEAVGYTKIDCLHLSALDPFDTREQLLDAAYSIPQWQLFCDSNITNKLFQLGNAHQILKRVKPTSVQEVADCIALLRPGKRQHLAAYIEDHDGIRPLLYRSGKDDKSAFRRGHAIAYALTAIAQLNSLTAGS